MGKLRAASAAALAALLVVVALVGALAPLAAADGVENVKVTSNGGSITKYLLSLEKESTVTKFERKLDALVNLLNSNEAPIKELEGWVNALRERRKDFVEKKKQKNGKTAVVVGGGPMGLVSAFLLYERGYDVKVFERSRQDWRWNSFAPCAKLAIELEKLGITGGPVGTSETVRSFSALSELDYSLAASLIVLGVEIKFNTAYMRHCVKNNVVTVHVRSTPAKSGGDDEDEGENEVDVSSVLHRNHYFTEGEVCATNENLGEKYAGHEAIKADVLVGADGTKSPVREALGFTFADVDHVSPPVAAKGADMQPVVVEGLPDLPLTASAARRIEPEQNGGKKGGGGKGKGVLSPTENNNNNPEVPKDRGLGTHLIIALDTKNEQLQKHIAAQCPRKPKVTQRPFTPGDERFKVENDFDAQFLRDNYDAAVAYTVCKVVSPVDSEGITIHRVYVDVMLRHEFSAAFNERFPGLFAAGAPDLFIKYAKGDKSAVENMLKSKATQVVDFFFALFSFEAAPETASPFSNNVLATFNVPGVDWAADDSRANFVTLLDRAKAFKQQLRVSSGAAKLHGKSVVYLAGDSLRDSYYVFGNSVNWAYETLLAHQDLLLAANKEAIKKYHKEVAVDFVNHAGADMYYRFLCGCVTMGYSNLAVSPDVHRYHRNIECKAPEGQTVTLAGHSAMTEVDFFSRPPTKLGALDKLKNFLKKKTTEDDEDPTENDKCASVTAESTLDAALALPIPKRKEKSNNFKPPAACRPSWAAAPAYLRPICDTI